MSNHADRGDVDVRSDDPGETGPIVMGTSRRRVLRTAGMVAGVPLLGAVLAACGASTSNASTPAPGGSGFSQGKDPLPQHPAYKFAFINHVTTNPFFTPTRYGIADACDFLGCTYSWTGSTTSSPSEMVTAMNTATAAGVDGIAVAVIDNNAFVGPINSALDRGIPVVAYNADATKNVQNNHYMSYVGQDNFTAGQVLAQRLVADGAVKSGDLVGAMIATPGTLNIQPRLDGIISVLKPAGVEVATVATGALLTQEFTAVDAWYQGHTNAKFMVAVDDGSSEAVADAIKKYSLQGKVGGAGWDVSTPVLNGLKAKSLLYTIDQQAYLQGFIPIVQMFMYNISGGLMLPCNTDTGLTIVTQNTVDPYLSKQTRFEGSNKAEEILTRPAKITV